MDTAEMIPKRVNYYDSRSNEEIMFDALKQLPKGYYVFHSFKIHRFIEDDYLARRECDFVVFHPEHGVLCIECKSNTKISPKDYTGFFFNLQP